MPAGSCTNRGFSILVDTNQMNADEANNDAQLAADGVWAVVVNSSGGPSPITDPHGTWSGALARLNAAHWLISEDYYNNYVNFYQVHDYSGLWPNVDMVYVENDPANATKGPDTVLTTGQIDDAYAHTANPVVVGSRSYSPGDGRTPYVKSALTDPHCVGVDFETNPGYASISGQSFNQGIADVLASGRRVYMLLPPDTRPGHDYAADMQSGVTQYLANSPQISNPNLYLVLAVYGRDQTNVGFLQPPPVPAAATAWPPRKAGSSRTACSTSADERDAALTVRSGGHG